MPTEKGEENVILFTKEQFNAGLRFPLPALFKEFLHFSQIPPIFIHPNLVRCVRAPALPSNGDRAARFDKGGAKGLVAVRGGWAGLSQRASRPFSPNYTLKIGLELRGHLVDWVEKASRLCLQIIRDNPKERAYKTLLSARNLSGRPGVPGICSRTEAGSGLSSKENSRKKEEAGEEAWEGCEGTHSSQGVSSSQITYEGEVMIEEPVNAAPHSISSGPGRMSGLNHSGLPWPRARLANVAEEAASINRPGNLNPDADAAETAPLEEAGAESQSQPSDDPDRLAIVRCASAHDAHPDGGEVEMATETSAAPAIIPAEDASGQMRPDEDVGVPNPGQESPSVSSSEEEPADDAAPASPFSYADMIYVFAFLVCVSAGEGPPQHAQQHDLFTQLLQTADYMRTFSSRRQEIENQAASENGGG
ncbi:hypothetical protein CK203_057387 [Vitis vinifera]|uniref:Uncharacterized protein n=1 Tax=Vitis vinifera TaxID=29760 RepID=A0A438FUF7_VITVI|nr:hypothetical protein CK203_057387 [Vitis vinifera]